MSNQIEQQMMQLDGIKHLLTKDEYTTKRTQILAAIGSSSSDVPTAMATVIPQDEEETETTDEKNKTFAESMKDTVTDKGFLKGAGLGFLTGAVVGGGVTHIYHKKKKKKSSSDRSGRNTISDSDSDDDDQQRYPIGTKVWMDWGWAEYTGTVTNYDSKNELYHIVWNDGDQMDWSEKKVRKSRKKKGLK